MSFIDDDNETDDLALDFVPADVRKELYSEGWYSFEVENIKAKWNDDNDVMNIAIALVFIDGPYEGRKIFTRHCGKSTRTGEKAETMVRIGREQLGSFARGVGIADANLRPAIGQRVQGKVIIRKGSGGYDDSNEVREYKPMEGASAPKPNGNKGTSAPATDNKPGFMKPKG